MAVAASSARWMLELQAMHAHYRNHNIEQAETTSRTADFTISH